MKVQDVLPVLVSIVVLVLVAIVEKQSKLLAAVTATMPVNVALALWIVHASSGGERTATVEFTRGMLLSIIPTLGFLVAVWLCSRAGLKLVPTLLVGYSVWGIGHGILLAVRRLLGL
jgi:uncharacterized membrane protein (GlpM family)